MPLQKPSLGTQLDWSHPLARGLIVCLPLNEGAGSMVQDLCGGANNRAVIQSANNSTWNARGVQHNYTTSTTAIDITGGPVYRSVSFGRGAHTVAYRVNISVCYLYSSKGAYGGWSPANNDIATIRSFYPGNTVSRVAMSSNLGHYGKPHTFIHTCGGADTYDTYKHYFDGENVPHDSGTSTNGVDLYSPFAADTAFSVGSSQTIGTTEWCYVWNRELSAAEAQAITADPFCFFARPSLISMYVPATGFNPSWGITANTVLGGSL